MVNKGKKERGFSGKKQAFKNNGSRGEKGKKQWGNT